MEAVAMTDIVQRLRLVATYDLTHSQRHEAADEIERLRQLVGRSAMTDIVEPASCRFPRGDQSPLEYCGQMQQNGSRYCPYHHRIAYLSVSSRPKFAIPAPWVDYRGGRT